MPSSLLSPVFRSNVFHFCVIIIVSLLCVIKKVNSSSKIGTTRRSSNRKLVIGIDGGTESIRASCFNAVNGKVVGKSCAIPYKTQHPNPGWAEQNPEDWYENLGKAVRGALASVIEEEEEKGKVIKDYDVDYTIQVKSQVCAICVDTTCCSVVALDKTYKPLRPSLLWMDARSSSQTREILDKCTGDPALAVNCNGAGPISAEWMSPKALWIKQNEPRIWKKTHTLCEYQDYINFQLTGNMCANSCNAAARWHWDGRACITMSKDNEDDEFPGRPISLYEKLGMPELAVKLPKKCLPMGSLVGKLTAEAANHLGLEEGVPVAQGGPDAFVGMIGLGCIHPKQLCLITGSSHLHCVVSAKATTAAGSWGAYKGAPLPTINFAEGGQSSTGSIIRWAKNIFGSNIDYKTLDDEAAEIPPGSDGLVALETFQGSRTPLTDPLARGALVGLTLSHTRGHIWRALMEAVCFGTRACINGLELAGHECSEIIIAGGTTRSPLWLQMHADVTGKPVVLCENIDAPMLGCAILASVGAGIHATVEDAVNSMVRTSKRVEPRRKEAITYTALYDKIYINLSPSVRPVVHAIATLRGGGYKDIIHGKEQKQGEVEISPSLLASDWANISSEIKKCIAANLHRLHIDVFDGVFLDSPYALTFGPQMVKAMRSVSNEVILDIHLCVDRPSRFVEAMANAGANRIIFQFEAMGQKTSSTSGYEEALSLAKQINGSGMQCGISLNPETELYEIFPLLETGFIDVVDLLAVEPGFGGQSFQEHTLQKIMRLRKWFEELGKSDIQIMVDGGINDVTSKQVREAGANILVAGTFLFRHSISMKRGVQELLHKKY